MSGTRVTAMSSLLTEYAINSALPSAVGIPLGYWKPGKPW